MQIVDLPLTKIEIPAVRITSHMPPEIAEQFRLSVQSTGVLEPLLVVCEGERYYLVNGLHRLQEANVRGDPTIPAAVLPGTLQEVLLWNLVTSGLHGRPKHSEVRQVIKALEDEYHLDLVSLRKKTGLSEDYLSRLMWVNRAIPQVQEALDDEAIALGHAVALARVEDVMIQARLLDVQLQHHCTVQILEQICRDAVRSQQQGVAVDGHFALPPLAQVPTDPLCDNCGVPTPMRHLKPMMLCPVCFGQMYDAIQRTAAPADA